MARNIARLCEAIADCDTSVACNFEEVVKGIDSFRNLLKVASKTLNLVCNDSGEAPQGSEAAHRCEIVSNFIVT